MDIFQTKEKEIVTNKKKKKNTKECSNFYVAWEGYFLGLPEQI
jgi:hypothetical protein